MKRPRGRPRLLVEGPARALLEPWPRPRAWGGDAPRVQRPPAWATTQPPALPFARVDWTRARPRAFVPGQAPRHALISGGLSAADSAAPHREVTVRGLPPPGPLPLAAPPGSLSAAGGALADWRGKARAWATSEAEARRRNALGADGP